MQHRRLHRRPCSIQGVLFALAGFLAFSFLAHGAMAADIWTVTTADFQSQRVELRAINPSGVTVAISSADQPQQIPYERLLMIQRSERIDAALPAFVVNLFDGDRAAGQPRGIEGENLLWETTSLGRLSLPMRNIQSITRGGASASSDASAPQTEDVITLSNGDNVRGIIVSIDPTIVTVQVGADKTTAAFDSLSSITFASPPTPQRAAAPRSPGFRISLADSTAITANRIELRADNTLSFTTAMNPGAPRSVPLAAVVSVEQVNGPVIWLSALKPVEVEQTSFFDVAWPARMDRAVDGSAIRFGDRSFTHGIGVHSRSRLTFTIDPSWQSFRTQYAIAGDWAYANVDVRIQLDGQVVHEKTAFRSGQLAQPVIIDTAGHKQLILEVDYGQNYDVQDRFNWIEPAFLKFKPNVSSSAQP